jgi:hypothetical protein
MRDEQPCVLVKARVFLDDGMTGRHGTHRRDGDGHDAERGNANGLGRQDKTSRGVVGLGEDEARTGSGLKLEGLVVEVDDDAKLAQRVHAEYHHERQVAHDKERCKHEVAVDADGNDDLADNLESSVVGSEEWRAIVRRHLGGLEALGGLFGDERNSGTGVDQCFDVDGRGEARRSPGKLTLLSGVDYRDSARFRR